MISTKSTIDSWDVIMDISTITPNVTHVKFEYSSLQIFSKRGKQ